MPTITAATKRGLRPTAMPDITARARTVFKLVNGAPRAFEADGTSVRYGRDAHALPKTSRGIAGEVFAGVSYRFTDWCSATLSYRYLHEEYSRGGFALNLDTCGFLLGFGFHF